MTFSVAVAAAVAPSPSRARLYGGQIPFPTVQVMHAYEVRPRKDHRGVDLIFDALPFGRLWYGEPNAVASAMDYAKFRSRSHRAVICVYDSAGNVIETHEQAGEFKEP